MTKTIDILQHELDNKLPHWLSPAGKGKPSREPDRATIRAKHREAWAQKQTKPASPETVARGRAEYERVKAKDPNFDPDMIEEKAAFNRYRERQRTAYQPDVGEAEAAGFNRRREKHGRTIAPGDPPPPTPTEQVAAWGTAIRTLDTSEIAIRDSIERDLAGKTGKFAELRPSAALKAVNRLVAKIARLRERAIKAAFVSIRDQMGDGPLLDIPLARWAHYFAQQDTKAIDAAIQSALAIGDDSAEIARKVVGSMHLNGVDGVTELTRHKLAHLGRAAIKRSIPRK